MDSKTTLHRPRLAVTMGDPAGVGPEVIVKALQDPWVQRACRPVIIGDVTALHRAMGLLKVRLPLKVIQEIHEIPSDLQEEVAVLCRTPLSFDDITYGRPSAAACRETIQFIRTAVDMTLTGHADAMVTGPIHKDALHRHGFPFPGHTEFLQDLTGASRVVMMLAGPKLRVALATIHCALRDVPEGITQESLMATLEVLAESLKCDFGISSPRIAVSGLNPHAGEAGRFGREELEVIAPVVNHFRRTHPWCDTSGPYPPDTVFFRAFEGHFDVVLALYHDQGLIPLKLVHFHEAANVTLGLPILRTSVDHGTGYDIAGKGIAHCGSLLYAMQTAVTMVRHRKAERIGI
ncbi:MAG: 4-hydroxythreonine-4-phosphate dehydrogenase PdxA [Desulfosoma sp.]|uniref:4-hydroxythreonine-4-phosphate dehydrogenase PdxA n=1 Tax=Desulfosoma sp. TaxID=2603217 RepID=UPI00404B36C2